MGKYTTDPLRTGREIEKADALDTLGGDFGLCWNDTVPLTMGVKTIAVKTAPIDRFGSPADHQGACVFLASEASDFMVGQEIVLDGGYTIM